VGVEDVGSFVAVGRVFCQLNGGVLGAGGSLFCPPTPFEVFIQER